MAGKTVRIQAGTCCPGAVPCHHAQVRPEASIRPQNASASVLLGTADVRSPALLCRPPSTVSGPGNTCGPKFSQ